MYLILYLPRELVGDDLMRDLPLGEGPYIKAVELVYFSSPFTREVKTNGM